jgi:hypothetical protein
LVHHSLPVPTCLRTCRTRLHVALDCRRPVRVVRLRRRQHHHLGLCHSHPNTRAPHGTRPCPHTLHGLEQLLPGGGCVQLQPLCTRTCAGICRRPAAGGSQPSCAAAGARQGVFWGCGPSNTCALHCLAFLALASPVLVCVPSQSCHLTTHALMPIAVAVAAQVSQEEVVSLAELHQPLRCPLPDRLTPEHVHALLSDLRLSASQVRGVCCHAHVSASAPSVSVLPEEG